MGHGWNKKIHTNGGWLLIYHGRIRNQKKQHFIQTKVVLPKKFNMKSENHLCGKGKNHLPKLHLWVVQSFLLIPTSSIASALRAVRPDATFDISHRHWWPPSKPPRWPNAERGRRVFAAVVFTTNLEVVNVFLRCPSQNQTKNGHETNPLKWDCGCLPSRELTYPTLGTENHLQNGLFRGYVSSEEGTCFVHGQYFCSKHNLQITICVNCLEQLWAYPEFKASYINKYKYKSTTQEWNLFLSQKERMFIRNTKKGVELLVEPPMWDFLILELDHVPFICAEGRWWWTMPKSLWTQHHPAPIYIYIVFYCLEASWETDLLWGSLMNGLITTPISLDFLKSLNFHSQFKCIWAACKYMWFQP